MSQSNQPLTSSPSTAQSGPNVTTGAGPPAITSVAKLGAKLAMLQVQASFQALVSGLQSAYQPSDTFRIAGRTVSRDEVIAQLNAFISNVEATKAARQQWLSTVERQHASFPAANALRRSLRGIVEANLGSKTAAGLTTFGFAPAKSATRTVADKATAIAKTAATRTARHTMGKVQKAAITGDVVGIRMTPLVAGPPTIAASSTEP